METNHIYNEDCLETMKRMPDNFVDMTLTSPPYNMLIQTKYNKYIRRILPTHKANKYTEFQDNLWMNDFYERHKKILNELLRVSKIVVYNFQIVTGSKEAFFKLIGDFNLYIKDIIIWDKCRSLPASREKILNRGYEMILILESDKRLGVSITNAKFKRCEVDNILRIKRKKDTDNNLKHNATFPLELAEKLIQSFSDEGNLVYDPFMGTGTTAKMALMLKRNYIGSEISAEYTKLAEQRIKSISNPLF